MLRELQACFLKSSSLLDDLGAQNPSWSVTKDHSLFLSVKGAA